MLAFVVDDIRSLSIVPDLAALDFFMLLLLLLVLIMML
jgi:hypothetical protein